MATKVQYESEKKTLICGTPNYTSPEMVRIWRSKEGYSYQVDIWSMGIMIFALLTGNLHSKQALSKKHIEGYLM